MNTPWTRYQSDLQKEGFSHDPSQEMAVKALQVVYEGLVERHNKEQTLLGRLALKSGKPRKKVQGLYFWGGVGRGKTYLMDTFFDAIPFENKQRLHFHHFMRRVHKGLESHKGKKNPLILVAKEIAQEAHVLCFDEFFVSDIGDAMILATLLTTLFDEGVTLIATSNIEPKYLYKDGLQRSQFIPAIKLLEQHTDILNVDGGTDYRLRTLKQVEIFHSPLDDQAEKSLNDSFERLAPDIDQSTTNEPLDVLGRMIVTRRMNDDVVLFDFKELCEGPRSQNDYIEIAQCFHAVLLSNVPVFNGKNDDSARRFIYMVDEFYDRNVKLLMTAEKPIHEIYSTGKLNFEFQRTVSRLLEMQSEEYLKAEHKA
ncbi:cell division protein ZapE [Reinekea marina]|uniref:Cell division protein ZapE n=1 Tax=Reinekea marina TaxID=1310421 RepID=A0ABV7WNS9_9GAMM|nr:cell division protein ZapE [Reinekea marina]MDN3648748.1 cell division protein ZapE [Reinekea marina]